MSHMFSWCSSLIEINLSIFNTDNVTDMSSMFSWCSSLKELNVSNFNTNNVIYMFDMFVGCSSLIELNLSNFNIKKVISMNSMLNNCRNLEKLDISSFIVSSKFCKMDFIFFQFKSLYELNISNFSNNERLFEQIKSDCSKILKKKIFGKNKF